MKSKTSICNVGECYSLTVAIGLCNKHYKRWKTFGSTDVKHRSKAPLKERFWLFVDRRGEKECWLWTGSVRGAGYGRISDGARSIPAHRVSYELHYGPIPEGLLVCHKCDVPGCVNPNHLFVGTQKENLADRNAKGRFHPVKGEKHGRSKLTNGQVRLILKDSRKHQDIASDHGISSAMVCCIKARKNWTHIHI